MAELTLVPNRSTLHSSYLDPPQIPVDGQESTKEAVAEPSTPAPELANAATVPDDPGTFVEDPEDVFVLNEYGLMVPRKSKWRVSSQCFHLVYSFQFPKKEYIEWLGKLVEKTYEVKHCFIAHESADPKNPYLHSHVALEFNKIFQSTNARFFDYPVPEGVKGNPHPKIFKVGKGKHWRDLLWYISKEDPELKGLRETASVTKVPIAQAIWEQTSLTDALMMAKKPSDAQGIIALYEHKGETFQLRPWEVAKQEWQIQFMNWFSKPVDHTNHRYIHWFHDQAGSIGKTEIIKNTFGVDPRKWYFINDFGRTCDTAQVVINAFKSGWNGHAFIANLCRAGEAARGLYTSLEQLCDGMVTSTKFSGRSKIWTSGHVIVFANWLPKYCYVTANRWQIYHVTKGTEIEIKESTGQSFQKIHVSHPHTCTKEMWDDSYRAEHGCEPPQE